LLIFSCHDDSGGGGDFTDIFKSPFHAAITLTENNIAISDAEVFIRYKCNTLFDAYWYDQNSSWCEDENSTIRPSTTINFSLQNDANVSIDLYNIDNSLIINVLNEFLDMGEHTISIEMPNPPFGLALVTLKLEVTNSEGELINSNENQLFLITAFDFEMIENLGSTNELGLFELTSSYHKWIPTFYPPVEMNSTDEFGSVLGTHTQYDLVDNFEIIFLKDGIYKTFDIDLKDGDYDYSFEWNDGEIFN